jgi:antitoxin HicB
MSELYKIPLVLSPQPEGGYTVTSPVLPELVTEGDTPDDVMDNVRDALDAALELYEDEGRPLPRIGAGRISNWDRACGRRSARS